jgi:hypothetical protein
VWLLSERREYGAGWPSRNGSTAESTIPERTSAADWKRVWRVEVGWFALLRRLVAALGGWSNLPAYVHLLAISPRTHRLRNQLPGPGGLACDGRSPTHSPFIFAGDMANCNPNYASLRTPVLPSESSPSLADIGCLQYAFRTSASGVPL